MLKMLVLHFALGLIWTVGFLFLPPVPSAAFAMLYVFGGGAIVIVAPIMAMVLGWLD